VSAPIRVLVVDDSAFARKVMREMLHEPDMLVVGIARDGLEALEQIAELKPDVITLDLMMPNLDGLGVLRALPAEGAPRVVVVSISSEESELGVAALQAGAITVVQKPTALATEQLYELEGELRRAVIAAAAARSQPPRAVHAANVAFPAHALDCELVAIGTSTGGPQALTELLAALPQNFPVPLAIALHIPAGYTEELAQRLDRACQIDVLEATEGLVLRPGLAVLARGGAHLQLTRSAGRLAVQLSPEPRSEPHAPSVDVLFESAVDQLGAAVLGVVLTGMGSDGLRGARAIRAAGGRLLAEAERSCVVYGMPRVVKEAGLCDAEAALEDMALAIARHLGPERGASP
jgi:two-component system, chemotaxis family, protein-glutamate methylesterase/glutaminase